MSQALKLKRRLQKKYISPDEIEPDPIPTRGLFQDDYYEDDEDGFDEFEDGNDDEGRPARGGAAPPSVVRRRPGKGKKPAAAPPPPPPKKRRQQCDLCLKEFAEMEEFETHIIREHGKVRIFMQQFWPVTVRVPALWDCLNCSSLKHSSI